jgi:hypothetical protein
MFDLTKQPILLALAAVASFTIGACFNGSAADGLPCDNDLQCGPGSGCIEGFCAGVFLCADGTLLDDAAAACNGAMDCADKSDEDSDLCGGAGTDINQCEAEPNGDLVYQLGASTSAPGNANKVEALDIMGSPSPDAIVAGREGDHVKIAFDLESGPKEYFFDSPPPSFGGRKVFGFEVGEVNGDMKPDVVIIAAGEAGASVYVYQSMSPNPPELFGAEIVVPEMVGEVTLRGFQLGRLNNDSSTDIVAVLDIAAGPTSVNGLLLVSFGDSMAAAGGQPYFNPMALPELPLGYDMFADLALADIDGNGFDDLLVSGVGASGPGLWIVRRNPDGDVTSWEDPISAPIMAPGLIAIGHFDNATPPGQPLPGMPDLAILDPNNGTLQTMLNMNGMLQAGSMSTLSGSGFASASLSDMNCDGRADFVYSLTDPTEIRVLFGDGLGGVLSDAPLTYADQGTPRGGLGIALFDDDSTPDIFSASDPGGEQMDTQVRVLVSGAE